MNRRRDVAALSDRYELQNQLGAGGMAEVYLGRDRLLGRTVAIKTLLSQYARDPHFIERFRREAQNAAALNHPNIVSIYDTGEHDDTHYIVMEYVAGRTLREVVRDEGPLLPERMAEIAAEVCAGLAYAHQHGIVHRDIKPANIMITTGGQVKVADFGIARAVSGDTVTQTAMVLGTAQYFSPEQAQSLPVDARSDIYSLGVVLYEMLAGQVPFAGSSPVAIAYKHVKEPPVPPSQVNPDVPPGLEAIVLKALAKNPQNRYQSAEEMRQDLTRWMQGQPVLATPVLSEATGIVDVGSDETVIVQRRTDTTLWREPTPQERRRRTGLILLGLIGLAIIAVAGWAVWNVLSETRLARVPDVLGEPLSRADQRLSGAGFKVDIADEIYSDTFRAGTIARQDPPPGEQLAKGETVRIWPSLGIELVDVPDVVGKTQGEARRVLEDADLKVGEIDYENSDERYGVVLRQAPTGGSKVAKGESVRLVVSQGPETKRVPHVTGRFEDDAVFVLESAGFRVQLIREAQNPECAQDVGRVCRQKPDGDSTVQEGSTVTIWVAEQPEEEEPSPLPSPSPSPTPTATPSPSPVP